MKPHGNCRYFRKLHLVSFYKQMTFYVDLMTSVSFKFFIKLNLAWTGLNL